MGGGSENAAEGRAVLQYGHPLAGGLFCWGLFCRGMEGRPGAMIAGYNTDVRHAEVVFHVQTEDKGSSNPFIESLVYVGGRVLAAKRASYADLLAQGKGAEAISELMDAQHRNMIAAIRKGKFDDKVEALLGSRPALRPAAPPAASEVDDLLAATKMTEAERTLDQVILEYLTNEAQQEQLRLVLEQGVDLSAGRPAKIKVRALSSKSGEPVAGARIEIKHISTVAEARTLASGQTDPMGGIELAFSIPDLGRGSAALIIAADSDLGPAELKQLL